MTTHSANPTQQRLHIILLGVAVTLSVWFSPLSAQLNNADVTTAATDITLVNAE